jgi:hypothetical protein
MEEWNSIVPMVQDEENLEFSILGQQLAKADVKIYF